MTQRIVPFLGYEDAAAAIEWLRRAFGFVEDRAVRREQDGVITHSELALAGATIYLSTPQGYASPRSLREESELARRLEIALADEDLACAACCPSVESAGREVRRPLHRLDSLGREQAAHQLRFRLARDDGQPHELGWRFAHSRCPNIQRWPSRSSAT